MVLIPILKLFQRAPSHGAANQHLQHQMHGVPRQFCQPRMMEVPVHPATSMAGLLLGEAQGHQQLEANRLVHPMLGVRILVHLQHQAHCYRLIYQCPQTVPEVQKQDQEVHSFLVSRIMLQRI
uniref:Uncharacterized protein n=1 Tax=Arundo donax TaxID=35708 RepID=A0A0A9C4B8_ARUDO